MFECCAEKQARNYINVISTQTHIFTVLNVARIRIKWHGPHNGKTLCDKHLSNNNGQPIGKHVCASFASSVKSFRLNRAKMFLVVHRPISSLFLVFFSCVVPIFHFAILLLKLILNYNEANIGNNWIYWSVDVCVCVCINCKLNDNVLFGIYLSIVYFSFFFSSVRVLFADIYDNACTSHAPHVMFIQWICMIFGCLGEVERE